MSHLRLQDSDLACSEPHPAAQTLIPLEGVGCLVYARASALSQLPNQIDTELRDVGDELKKLRHFTVMCMDVELGQTRDRHLAQLACRRLLEVRNREIILTRRGPGDVVCTGTCPFSSPSEGVVSFGEVLNGYVVKNGGSRKGRAARKNSEVEVMPSQAAA